MGLWQTIPAMILCGVFLGGKSSWGEEIRSPEPTSQSPYRVDWALDLPLTFTAGVVSLVPELIGDDLGGPWCGLGCDATHLNALDRTVVGNRSAQARVVSDALVWSNLALPFVANLADVLISQPRDGWEGYAKDSLVMLEAMAVNDLLNQLVKYAVRRPRPYVYDPQVPDAERTQPDAALSFYSAHTSRSFCMATAYSTTFMRRHPDSPWVIPVWLGTHLLSATTGVLRVQAGKHFWTDVLIGALAGSLIGYLVPTWHRAAPPAAEAAETSLKVGVAPLVLPEGLGVALSVW